MKSARSGSEVQQGIVKNVKSASTKFHWICSGCEACKANAQDPLFLVLPAAASLVLFPAALAFPFPLSLFAALFAFPVPLSLFAALSAFRGTEPIPTIYRNIET